MCLWQPWLTSPPEQRFQEMQKLFQTKKTDLKQLNVRQHEVALPLNAIKTHRMTSAEQIDI